MMVVGTLVIALTVLVNFIVCPGSTPGSPERQDEPPLRVVRMSAKDLPGVWTIYEMKRNGVLKPEIFPVCDYLDVVIKGNTIIGRDKNNELYPIYNGGGRNFIQMQFGHPAHTPKIWNGDDAPELGMFQALPGNTIKPQSSPPRNEASASTRLRLK